VPAATLLEPGVAAGTSSGREQLPAALTALMRDIGIPNGLNAVGYVENDVAALVEGAMKQQRLLSISPRPVNEDDLDAIFRESLTNW
jgi:alcohol dehydrogenase class IV